MSEKRRGPHEGGRALFVATLLCVLACLPASIGRASADASNVGFSRIGENVPEPWAFLKQCIEAKGYSMSTYQGETTLEKHVEKVNAINRTPAKIFLAVQLSKGERTSAMVAMTDAKKKEGRFLTIDEIPGLFAEESQRLAADIAAPFKVKVEHLPLFPLLGVTMPGAFVRIEYKEGEMEDAVQRLCEGVERYFTERMSR